MTIETLKALKDSGQFHHATYRNHGTLWEGLWIYKRDAKGFRGYEPAGRFAPDSPDLQAAENLVAHTGISVGSYGKG